MLFIGTFSGTVTLSQVFADIVGVMTGGITTSGGLSASFASGLFYSSAYPPGWTNYDAAAGSLANGVTPCVLRAAEAAGALYKNLYFHAPESNKLGFSGYGTWNSTTHTGTNAMHALGASDDAVWGKIKLDSATYAGGKLLISASARHLYIQAYTSANAAGGCFYCSEYSRDDAWNTVANGYPSWFIGGVSATSTTNLYDRAGGVMCRGFNGYSLTDFSAGAFCLTNGSAGLCLVPDGAQASFGNSYQASSNAYQAQGICLGAHSTNYLALSPAYLAGNATRGSTRLFWRIALRQVNIITNYDVPSTYAVLLGGNLTDVNHSMYYTQAGAGNPFDTCTIGSQTFVIATPVGADSTRAHLALLRG